MKVRHETVVDPEKKDPKAPSGKESATKAWLNVSDNRVPMITAGASFR